MVNRDTHTTAFLIGSCLPSLARRWEGNCQDKLSIKAQEPSPRPIHFIQRRPPPFPGSVQPHSPWLASQATSQRNAGHKHKRGASFSDTHHVNGEGVGGTKREEYTAPDPSWDYTTGDKAIVIGPFTMSWKREDFLPITNIWAYALNQKDLDI